MSEGDGKVWEQPKSKARVAGEKEPSPGYSLLAHCAGVAGTGLGVLELESEPERTAAVFVEARADSSIAAPK